MLFALFCMDKHRAATVSSEGALSAGRPSVTSTGDKQQALGGLDAGSRLWLHMGTTWGASQNPEAWA